MPDKSEIHIDKIKPRLFLEDNIVFNICKIGQLEKTCRYVAAGQHGFACLKLMPEAKEKLDKIVEKMIAKGNNCEGIQMLEGHKVGRN